MSDIAAMENPLLPDVLRLLREIGADGIGEYDLLKRLEAAGIDFYASGIEPDLLLFRKHFLLMNALYRLQDILWREENIRLAISPLRIALEPCLETTDGRSVGAAAESGALRDYYLDWSQLEGTDADAVAALLDGFWQRFHATDVRGAALVTLQLDAGADWPTVRAQYRRLAASTHPDRGGDGAEFLAVREAYEILRLAMRR